MSTAVGFILMLFPHLQSFSILTACYILCFLLTLCDIHYMDSSRFTLNSFKLSLHLGVFLDKKTTFFTLNSSKYSSHLEKFLDKRNNALHVELV